MLPAPSGYLCPTSGQTQLSDFGSRTMLSIPMRECDHTATDLIDRSYTNEIKLLEDNVHVEDKRWTNSALDPKNFSNHYDGDMVILDAWMIKPIDFDPTKNIPSSCMYNRTCGSTAGQLGHRWTPMVSIFAQQGLYHHECVDNRGTRVPRGRSF